MFLSFFRVRPSYIFIYSFEMSSTIKSRLQQKLKDKEKEEEKKHQSEIIKLQQAFLYTGNVDNRIIKCGDHVNFNFDTNTGNFNSITDGAYLIVPEELIWLKAKYIIFKSVNEIGGIFVIKDEMPKDDYPDAVSFIIVEKITFTDRLNLKIIVKLNINDIIIDWVDVNDGTKFCKCKFYYEKILENNLIDIYIKGFDLISNQLEFTIKKIVE